MKTTKRVKAVATAIGERALKSKVASRVLAVASSARDKAMESKAGKRAATRAEGLVDRLESVAGDTKPVKRVRETVKRTVAKASGRTSTARAEKAQKPAANRTKKKMPETIHTTSGGKRLPGNVAARAVRLGAEDFKPKKGKK